MIMPSFQTNEIATLCEIATRYRRARICFTDQDQVLVSTWKKLAVVLVTCHDRLTPKDQMLEPPQHQKTGAYTY